MSLIPVPFDVYLCAFEDGTWLGQSRTWCLVEKVLRGAPDDAPDAASERPVR